MAVDKPTSAKDGALPGDMTMTMTFNTTDLAGFFAARSRESISAEDALKDLESRNITGDNTVRKATPRAMCDSIAQRNGRSLNDLSSHELADLLNSTSK